jgi:hypothetical protein
MLCVSESISASDPFVLKGSILFQQEEAASATLMTRPLNCRDKPKFLESRISYG